MVARNANIDHHRSRVARAEQLGDAEAATMARRALKMAKAERYLKDLIESAPPLRPEDVERLRALLPPVVADGSGDAA